MFFCSAHGAVSNVNSVKQSNLIKHGVELISKQAWDLHTNVMPRSLDSLNVWCYIIFIFLLLNPVPGNETDARTPELRAFNVTRNGPSLIDCVNDLIPRSVMLNPKIVLSKLIGDFLVIVCC